MRHNERAFIYAAEMRRAPQELRTYFVTAVTANRRRLFQVHANAELLICLMGSDITKGRYALHAFVVMPDHIHLLLTPAPDVSLEKAMQFVKGGFSFRLKSKLDVWERSFKERQILDSTALETARRYIEQNPVRARLVDAAASFPFSSCMRTTLLSEPMWLKRPGAEAPLP